MTVCSKLRAHQLGITELRKDVGTSPSQGVCVNSQSDVSGKHCKQCSERKRRVGNMEVLMLFRVAEVHPHLEDW